MLQVDSTTTADVALQVGSISEAVQVTSEAPVINTTDASIGNVISGEQIRALPLEGGNVVGLLSLQPGVTFVPTTNPNTVDPRYGSVSGARADQSNVTLDGIDVNDPQNQSAFTSVLRVTLESVQEFRVTTSNYGAEQGRSSGAQVSLVTRSGTNTLSGTGYFAEPRHEVLVERVLPQAVAAALRRAEQGAACWTRSSSAGPSAARSAATSCSSSATSKA